MKSRFLMPRPSSKGLVCDIPLTGGFMSDGFISGAAVQENTNTYPATAIGVDNVELVTNGTFNSNIDGWSQADLDTFVWEAGELRIAETGTDYSYAQQDVGLVIGRRYKYSFYLAKNSGANLLFQQTTDAIATFSSSDSYSGTFLCTEVDYIKFKFPAAAGDWNIDAVSIRLCAVPIPVYPGFDFTAVKSHYIDIGAGPTSVKTVSLWVKQDDIAGNEYPIDLNGTDFISTISGAVTVNGFAGGTAILYVDSVVKTSGAFNLTAQLWHHLLVTVTVAKDASDFDIGRETANYFDGVISDVRLYDRVLGALEVLDIYNLQKSRYGR